MISLTVSNNDIFSLFLKWLFLYIISIPKTMIHITNKVTKVRLHPEIIYKINNETRNTLLHFLVFSDKNIRLRRKPHKMAQQFIGFCRGIVWVWLIILWVGAWRVYAIFPSNVHSISHLYSPLFHSSIL